MREALAKFMSKAKSGQGRRLKAVVALGVVGLALSGCVVYPSQYGYGGGYAAPAYYAPPVVVSVGGGWGWHGGWGGGGHWH